MGATVWPFPISWSLILVAVGDLESTPVSLHKCEVRCSRTDGSIPVFVILDYKILRELNNIKLFLTVLEVRKSKVRQGTNMVHFLVCRFPFSHMLTWWKESISLNPFYKDTCPIHEGHDVILSQGLHLPTPSHWGLGLQHMNLDVGQGEHKHSAHCAPLPSSSSLFVSPSAVMVVGDEAGGGSGGHPYRAFEWWPKR